MNELNDTQAIAARLTALQERLNIFASDGCHGPYGDEACFQAREDEPMEWCPNCAAQEAAKVCAHVETLTQQVAAYEKAAGYRTPEESAQVDRMKTAEINLITQEVHKLMQENARLTAALEAEREKHDEEAYNDMAAAKEQAEQQRDAAHAALKRIRGWDMLDATADGPFWKRELDAALAASAPQKE